MSDTVALDAFTELITLCEVQNVFAHGRNIYIMDLGIAMVSPLSSLLSDVSMEQIEKETEKLHRFKYVVYWGRYVDDVLITLSGTRDELDNFHKQINIKFTVEIENNNKLNFPDITIIKRANDLEFNIYRKPTSTDPVIPYDSAHHFSQKIATLHSLYHRAYNLSLSNEG